MEGDRPGGSGNEQERAGEPSESDSGISGTPDAPSGDQSPLGMGPPSGIPGGFGSTEAAYGTETVVEQRGWLSGARLTALLTAVVLVIAGTAVAVVLSGGDPPPLEEVVPAGAVAFGKVNLLPSDQQRNAVRALADRFPTPDDQDAGDAFERFLDQGLSEEGLSFERDFRPWLGTQLGFVVTDISFAGGRLTPRWGLVVAVRDEARAKQTLDKIQQDEPAMAYAIRQGHAFIAPELLSLERVLGAVDGNTGPLSGDATYAATVRRAGDDYLGLIYLDGEQLEAVIPPGVAPSLPGFAEVTGRQVITLRAQEDSVVVEGFSTAKIPGATGAVGLVEGAPEGLTGALTFFDPATLIEQGLAFAGLSLFGFQEGFGGGIDATAPLAGQQVPDARQVLDGYLRDTFGLSLDDDVLPWLHGELSIVVGRLALAQQEVGVLIESTDDAAAGRTVDALRDNLGDVGRDIGFEVTSAPGGFAVTFADVPISLIIRRVAGKIVIATSDPYADQLLSGGPPTLAEDTVYRQAVGDPGTDDVAFQLYVRIDRIASFAQAFVPPDEFDEAAPFVGPMQALGMRASNTPDGSTFRMVLTFK